MDFNTDTHTLTHKYQPNTILKLVKSRGMSTYYEGKP